jgi:thiamine biosynthesis lipoprotein
MVALTRSGDPLQSASVIDSVKPSQMSIYSVIFKAMGSRCEIRLAAADQPQVNALAQMAISEVHRIEAKYSRYRSDSVVSKIAAQAGLDWVVCDGETMALLDFADHLFQQSGGLFDVTSGVLRQAWNFHEPRLPDASHLEVLRELVNWQCVQRDGLRIRLPCVGMELDFGGFGKEYAADRAAGVLMARGVLHGYVNLGGDIRVLGPQLDGRPWLMGIQDPRRMDRMVATIPMEGGALATSGDYERFFQLGGQRYSHILHPQSGYPVDYWRSISVLAPSALTAGGISTIAMLKQGQAQAFLESAGLHYFAVDADGNVIMNRHLPFAA